MFVVTWLNLEHVPLIASQDFCLIAFLVGEVETVCTVSVLEPNQELSQIHRDESVFIREVISRNVWFMLIPS